MSLRLRTSLLFAFTLAGLACLPPAASAQSPAEHEAEAQRLFERAQAYVRNVTEGDYTYDYIQFYWKRAQANIDRIRRLYPATAVGRQVASDALQLGPFPFTYFRERVLARLETKSLAAFDAVNCAIFLFNLDLARYSASREAALTAILEVLSRQQRWSEALIFPVFAEEESLKLRTIFRIAAHFGQDDLVDELLQNAPVEELPALLRLRAEGLVYLGKPREEIAAFLDDHASPELFTAILDAMVEREIRIHRAALLRLDVAAGGIQRTHSSLLNVKEVRDDVTAVAREFFPAGHPAATAALARYRAGLGDKPAPAAAAAAHVAYVEFLVDSERFDEAAAYLPATNLAGPARQAVELALIEFYARADRLAASDALLAPYTTAGGDLSNLASLALFRGRIESLKTPFTVLAPTFASLPIDDPRLLAVAIMDWSLSPNRSIRGSSPWDPVVTKFLPGFDNLPLPESEEVMEASATSLPF